MKKTIGVLVLFFLVFAFSCKHNGGETQKPQEKQPNNGMTKVDYSFAEVPVGNRVIKGVKWAGSVPEYMGDAIQGVFVEGRRVKLSPYEIGKHEVSYKVWKDVCEWAGKNGYTGLENVGNIGNSEKGGSDIPTEQWNKQPATNMTWCQAVVWCNALTEMENGNDAECVYRDKTGKVLKNANDDDGVSLAQWADKKGCRLPSQAEWEAASRYSKTAENATNYAENGEPIYFTNNTSASGGKLPIAFKGITESSDFEAMKKELQRLAVCYSYFDGTKKVKFDPEIKFTSPIGSKEANDLGCFDMSGNISEFCYDWAEFKLTFDKDNIEENPKGPAAPSQDEFAKIFRGGAVLADSHYHSVAYIDYMENITDKHSDVGIRLARTK